MRLLATALVILLAATGCDDSEGSGSGSGGGDGSGDGGDGGDGGGPDAGGGDGGGDGADGGGDGGAGADIGPADAGPGPDRMRPKVQNVFSPDGVSVTVHFNEAMDAVTTEDPAHYQILGEDQSELGVTAVSLRGEFATLTLDPAAQINPRVRYTCRVRGAADLAGNEVDPAADKGIIRRTQYLAILWHQHQPFYLDPARDEMSGPWVRKHATKDYWDMAAMVGEQPDVHININLTPVLMIQMQIYVDRIGPFLDDATNRVDAAAFLAEWAGKTDPWIDLALRPTPSLEEATEAEVELLFKGSWATVSTSDTIMSFFPEYEALRDKNRATYTREDLLALKVFFELAWFDPDFLSGPVDMEDGSVVDLSDVVAKGPDGKFTLRAPATEDLANRLVAEGVKIMRNVVGVHRRLLWDADERTGQIEVTTTPFYHPILPLVHDTGLARQGQPFDPLPNPAYARAGDARAHVAKAVRFHTDLFGKPPRGMWPGEGSVAEEVVEAFVAEGVQWIATDQEVLKRSGPDGDKAHWFPYRVDVDRAQGDGGDTDDELAIVFRDTALSNNIGFAFQTVPGETAADELMRHVTAMAPPFGAADRLVTLTVDGENAWELYKEHDGKPFLRALYRRLQEAFDVGEVIPVTVSEYLDGNPDRNVPAHPVHEQRELEPLWAGSWIDSTFGIWVGEPEENQAWQYLTTTRAALARSGLPRPNPLAASPAYNAGSRVYWIWRAWEEMYAAEGSDWFWWYGVDMTSPGNDDTPFDRAFRSHLTGTYEAINEAFALGGREPVDIPEFAPIVQATPKAVRGPFDPPPVMDGRFHPDEGEWDTVGGFFFDNDSPGATQSPDDDLAQVFYGYDDEALYVAGQFNEDLHGKLGSAYQVRIYLPHKHVTDPGTGTFEQDPFNATTREGLPLQLFGAGVAREVTADFSGGGDAPTPRVAWADGDGGWTAQQDHGVTVGGPLPGGRVLEFRIPYATLGLALGDPMEIVVVVVEGAGGDAARTVDVAPTVGSKVVFEDVTNLVYVSFEVDATGREVDRNTYVQITTPPPPDGNGTVYISGNHDKLDNWIPNSIALRDTGTAGDAEEGDGIWTLVLGFPPGTVLRYKYTIGLPRDEGRWRETEEFPLTERGLDIPSDPDITRLRVQDIFADRPQPSGTTASRTRITNE